MEAKWGHTSRGKFRGFKLHAVVNQLGLPLRALITPGNCYDGPFLPKLIEDLEAAYVLADAAYCSKANFKAVRDIGAVPVIADNLARKGKAAKLSLVSFLGPTVMLLNSSTSLSRMMCWMNAGFGQKD
jgi:transposase